MRTRLPFKLLVQLGWRNLWRQRRRNLILLAAIVVAVATVSLTCAFIRGYQYDMMEDAVRNLTGDVKILSPGYRDDPSIEQSFALAKDWKPDIPETSLLGWTTRVRVPAVVMSERETRGIQLVGIDPADERDQSFVGDVRVVGERLRDTNDARILLGAALVEQLHTEVGRRVVVITQGADGLNREIGYRVAGSFDAEGTGLEKAYAFTGRAALQQRLDTQHVTEVSVRLKKEAQGVAADAALKREASGLEVLSWRELEPLAGAMFEFADTAILIWFFAMMIALGFGLVNTLITAVMERVRELGMLRALGMRPLQVVMQVLIESTLILVLGLGLGLVVGVGLIEYFGAGIDLSRWAAGIEMADMRSRMVPRLLASDLVLISWLSLVLGLIGSLYPAWRAIRIRPLDALRRGT